MVLMAAPLGASAQHALAMLSAAAIPLVISSRTAPGPRSIFNPAHPVLRDRTAVHVAVRLRGSGPSVNDSFGTVKV